jgi:HEAT repeat protein
MCDQHNDRLDALLKQLTEPNAEQRNQAALALAALHDHRAVEPLIVALHDRSKYVRANAAWALGQLRDGRAFDPLLLAVQDGRVNTTGVEALRLVDPLRAIDPVLQRLQAGEWNIRWHAARELYFLCEPRTADALMDLLKNDPVASVRSMAAQALGALHAKGVVIPLFEEADDMQEETRIKLALARLEELGVEVASEPDFYRLLIPHEFLSPRYIEIGYLMAQLAGGSFPQNYAPLTDVPSLVVPDRPRPQVEFRESYPAYLKYFIYRRRR